MRIGFPMRIMAAAAVLALGLVGLVVREGIAREQGREVVVEITGYDPRELLTGHYVRFQIRSERPPGMKCPPGSGGYSRRPGAWVALRRQGGFHVASGAALSREAAAKLGEVVVRGDLDCLERTDPDPTWVVMNLGVDQFHTDQEEAEAIEKALRGRGGVIPAQAVISVGRDGKARMKGLVVGGRRTDLSWY